MHIRVCGGPMDGMTLDLDSEPVVDEWHPHPSGTGGYRFDAASKLFTWQWVRVIEHKADSGHVFIFRTTCTMKLLRYCGQLAQTIYAVWSTGIFTWRDAAAISQEIRDKEFLKKVKHED